jgi:hypothetical protein
MSNFLAIATVTETLRKLLESAVSADVGGHATAVRPSGTNNTGTGGGLPTTGVNVFLYQIMPNPAGRNLDLPTRRADGSAIQKPRAAVDLHYMLTAYGQESTLEPQRVMGSIVRTMASRAILTRKQIDDAVGGVGYLAAQNLSVDVELVKFVPLALTLDELSRVWSVFFQTSYALSVCYQASVVFLDEDTAIASALPVRAANILARPIERPVIEAITPQPAHAGDTITLTGSNVGRGVPFVKIGDADPIPATVNGASSISVKLPATTRAGVSAVRVVQKIDFGTGSPSEPHAGYESNVAALALAARVITPAAGASIAIGSTVTVTVDAPVGRTQDAALILGSMRVPVPQRPWSDPDAATTLTTGPVPSDLKPGPAFLRFQVDGVDSPLDVDPVTGAYTGPKVIVS